MMEGHVEPHQAAQVGAALRSCRLRLGLNLSEVSRDLHIRKVFLEAIENDRFDALPAAVYAVGFVRSYAEHLGLDANEVVRRFHDQIVEPGTERPLHFPIPVSEGGTPRGGMLLLGLIIAMVAYTGWYFTSMRQLDVTEFVAAVPGHLQPIAASNERPPGLSTGSGPAEPAEPWGDTSSSTPAATASSGETGGQAPGTLGPPTGVSDGDGAPVLLPDVPTAAPATPTTGTTALAAEPPHGGMPTAMDPVGRIVLRAKSDSWVEVRELPGNSVLVARLLKAGDVYRIPDRPGLKLRTGNAGGLVVLIDGEAAPPLGNEGAVRRGIPLDVETLRRGIDGEAAQ